LIRLRLKPSVILALAFPRGYDAAGLVPLLDGSSSYILALAGGWRGLVESAEHVPLTLRTVASQRLCEVFDLTGNYATAAQALGVHQTTVWRAVKARATSRERELCIASSAASRRRHAS
jgi:hypothetical protein